MLKKSISIYHYSVLGLSETFIYRQIKGLREYFDVKLLTHEIENRDEFPDCDPLLIPRNTFWRRLMRQKGRQEERFFNKHLRGSHLFHVNFGHIAIWMQHHASRLGIPMTAYFLGVDASAYLKDQAFCDNLRKATFAAVFANSEDMKRRLTPHLPSNMKCHVAYCGIPLERFPFKQRHAVPEGALFLQVSRFEPKKGAEITLKAFSRYMKESDPKAKLIIAGDGPLKSDLFRISAALGLGENVSFLGHVGYKKYIDLLQSADVFIQPSMTSEDGDMEGLPTAICEAMACGLPVLSTRHSGIPEIIDHEENGFLVEERDVEGLCERMISLRKADIGDVSKKARIKIEKKFDHNRTVAILSEYMNDIITGGVCER